MELVNDSSCSSSVRPESRYRSNSIAATVAVVVGFARIQVAVNFFPVVVDLCQYITSFSISMYDFLFRSNLVLSQWVLNSLQRPSATNLSISAFLVLRLDSTFLISGL